MMIKDGGEEVYLMNGASNDNFIINVKNALKINDLVESKSNIFSPMVIFMA